MKIEFYTKNAKTPALDFIKALPANDRAKIFACLESIEELGTATPRVEFRQIRGKLWEIKIRSQGGQYRIFYVGIKGKNSIILLHAYHKKTQKAPNKEIDIAEKRMEEVLFNG